MLELEIGNLDRTHRRKARVTQGRGRRHLDHGVHQRALGRHVAYAATECAVFGVKGDKGAHRRSEHGVQARWHIREVSGLRRLLHGLPGDTKQTPLLIQVEQHRAHVRRSTAANSTTEPKSGLETRA